MGYKLETINYEFVCLFPSKRKKYKNKINNNVKLKKKSEIISEKKIKLCI